MPYPSLPARARGRSMGRRCWSTAALGFSKTGWSDWEMLKVGAIYPQIELNGDPEALHDYALAIERMGYDHLLMYDHVVGAGHGAREPKLTGPYTDRDPFHDPLVAFGYLAGITQRIELHTGVL